MTDKTDQTVCIDIYIAGDIGRAKQACREFCERGFCVHIHPVDYIYTGGEEAGFKIGIINYPRFPSGHAELMAAALLIAEQVREACCQDSYVIVGPYETLWKSRRKPEAQQP